MSEFMGLVRGQYDAKADGFLPGAPCYAVPCCAVLCCAVLCCAVLCCAVLCCAVLCAGIELHVYSQVALCLAIMFCCHAALLCRLAVHGGTRARTCSYI